MKKCSVCGRPLTSPESIQRGMGPVCYRRYLIRTGKLKFCSRCNRPLTDPESIQRGMGPVCYRRYLESRMGPVIYDEFQEDKASLTKTVRCKRCNRPLTDPISIEREYGKTCYEKLQEEHVPAPPVAVTGP